MNCKKNVLRQNDGFRGTKVFSSSMRCKSCLSLASLLIQAGVPLPLPALPVADACLTPLPALLPVTKQLGGVDFTGTFSMHDESDGDFVGFVFGFQDNSHFYLLSWKKRDQTYWLKVRTASVLSS